MEKTQFPIFKTKTEGGQRFNLLTTEGQKEYFQAKAGEEIEKLKNYLKNNTFIAYLLGKKNGGKGTYARLFREVVDAERIAHISIGDIVRRVHKEMSDSIQKRRLIDFLEQNYRGYISVEESIQALLGRDTKSLLPNEFILALVKREISEMPKKALLIDGFPRNLDQISYSLYFRDLIDYREDPDFFVLINVPEAVIDERIKYRIVCPECHSIRNSKLLPPAKEHIGYDKQKKEFYFLCKNSECKEVRLASKEGDELGIEVIRTRLEMDDKLISRAFSLYGIPKILLRNSVPVDKAGEYVDDYELTSEYSYKWSNENKEAQILEKPWTMLNDQGIRSYSLLPQPVVVSMIKQITKALSL